VRLRFRAGLADAIKRAGATEPKNFATPSPPQRFPAATRTITINDTAMRPKSAVILQVKGEV